MDNMNCSCGFNTQPPEQDREWLGVKCSEEDIKSLKLIQNKVNCAAQAARPDAIPDNVADNKAKLFIQSAIDSLASYRWLEAQWWDNAIKAYGLPLGVNVWIDFTTEEFYIVKGEAPLR